MSINSCMINKGTVPIFKRIDGEEMQISSEDLLKPGSEEMLKIISDVYESVIIREIENFLERISSTSARSSAAETRIGSKSETNNFTTNGFLKV